MSEPVDEALAVSPPKYIGALGETNWSGLVAVISSVGIVSLIYSVAGPLVSLNIEHRGYGSVVNGLLAAVPAIAILMLGTFVPIVVRQIGALAGIYLGATLAIVTLLALPLFDNLAAWFILRFIMGAAIGLVWIISETWVNVLAPAQGRGRVMGIYVTALSLGSACGPVLVGITGSGGELPFLISALILALALFPIWLASRGGAVPSLQHRSSIPLFRAVRRAPIPMIAAIVHGATFLINMTLLPVYGVRAGLPEEQAVLMLTVLVLGSVLAQMPIGHLVDKWGARWILLFCGTVQIGFACSLPFAVEHGIILWVLVFALGAFGSGTYTIALTLIGQSFKPEELPSANTAFTMFWEIGAFCGPIAAGLAMAIWNPYGMLVITAATGLTLMLLSQRIRQSNKASC